MGNIQKNWLLIFAHCPNNNNNNNNEKTENMNSIVKQYNLQYRKWC